MILLLTQTGELRENEASLVDLTNVEEGVEGIVECIHQIMLSELLSRSIVSMWDWEVRTRHMFEQNALICLRDITSLSIGGARRLIGCGYTTRKEVYDVFCMYHMKLKHWAPRNMNYKF